MLEQKSTGIYNANGLPHKLTMESLLEECKMTTESDASFTWVDDSFLLQEKVAPWSEMPLWMPEAGAPPQGLMLINVDKAVGAGLSFRPLGETIRDTLTWYQTNCVYEELKAGINLDKEQRLRRKWRQMH